MELKDRVSKAQAPLSEGSLLPLGYWSCKEFPKELSKLVDDIASNSSLKAPTKLRNVLQVVAQWYTSQIERMKSEMEVKNQHFKDHEAKSDGFLQFVVDLFQNMNVNLTNLSSEKSLQEEVKKYVNNLEKNELEGGILCILTELDADTLEQAIELVKRT